MTMGGAFNPNSDLNLTGTVTITGALNVIGPLTVTGPSAGTVVMSYRRMQTVPNARIKALPTKAAEVVAAQGPGTVILPVAVSVVLNNLAGSYTASADAAWGLIWGTAEASGTPASTPVGVAPLLGSGNTHLILLGVPTGVVGPLTDVANRPLSLIDTSSGVTDYTGGHMANSLAITVWYGVLSV